MTNSKIKDVSDDLMDLDGRLGIVPLPEYDDEDIMNACHIFWHVACTRHAYMEISKADMGDGDLTGGLERTDEFTERLHKLVRDMTTVNTRTYYHKKAKR